MYSLGLVFLNCHARKMKKKKFEDGGNVRNKIAIIILVFSSKGKIPIGMLSVYVM